MRTLDQAELKEYLAPVALFILAAGMIVIAALRAVSHGERAASRVAVPGEATVQLGAGEYMLYEDLPPGSGEASARQDLSCSIQGPQGPVMIDRSQNRRSRLKTPVASSVSFAFIEVFEPGAHVIKCNAGTSAKVSLRKEGDLFTTEFFVLLASSLTLEMVAVVAGALIWRRQRTRRREEPVGGRSPWGTVS